MQLISRYLLAILAIGLLCFACFARSPKDDWVRIQTDDGEFSIEVPKANRFFYNPDGFAIGNYGNDVWLKNMYLLSAVTGGSLISFEVYDAKKGILDQLYDADTFAKDGRQVSEKKIGDIKVREVINTTDKYYSVRWFFGTRKHVCVLTAASRNGETDLMRRFFDSLKVQTDAAASTDPNATRFSAMKTTDVEVESGTPETPAPTGSTNPVKDPNVKPFVLIRAARASYVDAARDRRVSGSTRLRLYVGEDGFISKVAIMNTLPVGVRQQGLLRQALFAALRAKVLPKEKDGMPIPTTVTMEFSFRIG